MEQMMIWNVSKDELRDLIASVVREELNARMDDRLGKEDKEYLSVDETCDRCHFSKSALYKLTASRAIPSIKAGKRLLLRKSDVDEYLARHRRRSIHEIRAEL